MQHFRLNQWITDHIDLLGWTHKWPEKCRIKVKKTQTNVYPSLWCTWEKQREWRGYIYLVRQSWQNIGHEASSRSSGYSWKWWRRASVTYRWLDTLQNWWGWYGWVLSIAVIGCLAGPSTSSGNLQKEKFSKYWVIHFFISAICPARHLSISVEDSGVSRKERPTSTFIMKYYSKEQLYLVIVM